MKFRNQEPKGDKKSTNKLKKYKITNNLKKNILKMPKSAKYAKKGKNDKKVEKTQQYY